MDISYRLRKVASFVDMGAKVADIGTDHAYIPIYLSLNNMVEFAIAMDLRKGPLEIATKNIEKYGFHDIIETRISNGLEKLNPDEVDTIIIAGMGGLIVNKILDNGKHILDHKVKLILQPQSEIGLVRYKLHEVGYKIVEEEILIDESKTYNIIVAIKGLEVYETKAHYLYGKLLIDQKNEILVKQLIRRKRKLEEILLTIQDNATRNSINRAEQIKDEIKIINEVQGCL